jgi:hypothetical protein
MLDTFRVPLRVSVTKLRLGNYGLAIGYLNYTLMNGRSASRLICCNLLPKIGRTVKPERLLPSWVESHVARMRHHNPYNEVIESNRNPQNQNGRTTGKRRIASRLWWGVADEV